MTITNIAVFNELATAFNLIGSSEFIGGTQSVNNYELYSRTDSQLGKFYQVDFLKDFPTLRTWRGKKVYKSVTANVINIENLPVEASIQIDKADFDLNYDATAKYVMEWGAAARGLINKRVVEKLVTAATAVGYDGVPVGGTHLGPNGTTQTNITNLALSDATLKAAISFQYGITDQEGTNLEIQSKKLVVGPSQMHNARQLVGAMYRTQTISNTGALDTPVSTDTFAGTAINNVLSTYDLEVIVEPNLRGTYANYWFVIGEAGQLKPMIVNIPKGLETKTDVQEFRHGANVANFSIEGYVGCDFGFWETIYCGIV